MMLINVNYFIFVVLMLIINVAHNRREGCT